MIVLIEDNKYYANNVKKKIESYCKEEVKIIEGYHDYSFIKADLYIVDLQLKGQMAYKIIEDIRANSDNIILILTASLNITNIIKGLKKGADIHMDKGHIVSPKLFAEKITAIIKTFNRLKK